jgi:hypothetical protein
MKGLELNLEYYRMICNQWFEFEKYLLRLLTKRFRVLHRRRVQQAPQQQYRRRHAAMCR